MRGKKQNHIIFVFTIFCLFSTIMATSQISGSEASVQLPSLVEENPFGTTINSINGKINILDFEEGTIHFSCDSIQEDMVISCFASRNESVMNKWIANLTLSQEEYNQLKNISYSFPKYSVSASFNLYLLLGTGSGYMYSIVFVKDLADSCVFQSNLNTLFYNNGEFRKDYSGYFYITGNFTTRITPGGIVYLHLKISSHIGHRNLLMYQCIGSNFFKTIRLLQMPP
jgi:hypothetical protein